MSVLQKNVLVSIEEYLEGEEHASVRHEYVRGQVYAMVGTTRAHNKIALTLAATLRSHLRGSGCEAFMSDMKVRIDDIFYYPDVLVTCSKNDAHPYYSTEPVLVVEVLSPTTEAVDRLDKRLAYQSLASLREYVLVAQDRREVQVYRRGAVGWDLEIHGAADVVHFTAVDLRMPVAAIYEGIES
jgi:Uma2 family endonuclease